MKKFAVVGTGSIGSLLGGCLSYSGYDTTMIPAFVPSQAQLLTEKGMIISSMEPGDNTQFHTPIKAVFIDDLSQERFDVILLALKSNDLETVVPKLVPYLAKDGYVVTFQNGINEEFLIPILGEKNIIAGSTFAGGHLIEPGHMATHSGQLYIGELDGTITQRLKELQKVLSCCKDTIATDHIRSYQWEKMGRVCLSVPSACISGLFLGDVFMELRLQKLFARLALEIFHVAAADGYPMDSLENKSRQEWQDIADGRLTGLEGRDEHWPPNIVDAYTADIQKGRPLEIVNTNGAVSRLGKRYGIPTPANDRIVLCVQGIAEGRLKPGFHLVDYVMGTSEE